jgi:CMP/dCMP kinase
VDRAEIAKRKLIITIDGPSGAGKSTVSKMLARALGYMYVDTGAMYRGVAVAFLRKRGGEDMGRFLKHLSISFEFTEEPRVYLDKEDISHLIRDPEVSLLASHLSQDRRVREFLMGRQRELGRGGGVVLEGRDTGTVVFPEADVKFYLDAAPQERARRRHLELSLKGTEAKLSDVVEEMEKRDKNDSERDIAPLTVPADAVRIDTTDMDARGVVDAMLGYISKEMRR